MLKHVVVVVVVVTYLGSSSIPTYENLSPFPFGGPEACRFIGFFLGRVPFAGL